ncbi:premnaspirodiene oxygenase-like [Solanum stenotomum]|uniref:premnaspirodiene oxygenase-like n=1 Tax=Solanum stenotomum TaxID=172797 RepID=UPI0020D01788|nr:premnaspirodiene oxygenase-like [Solanum stenotomum]
MEVANYRKPSSDGQLTPYITSKFSNQTWSPHAPSAIVISSPQLAKEMMKTHDLTFANRPQLSVAKIMFYDCQDIAFSPYGDYWKQIRKICVMELLSTKNITSFFPMMVDETYLLVNSIKAMSERPINISEKMYLLASAIICRASIGRTCKDQESVIMLMKQVASFAGVFNVVDLFPSLKILHFISGTNRKLLQLHRKVDPVLERIINEHETEQLATEHIGEDLVDVLLRLQDNNEFQIPITRNNIKAIILDMFVAGSATSSTVLEWAMSELLKNPSMMEKAQAEVREAFNGKTTIDQTDLKKLKYLKMVIKETLRFHPPGPLSIPRESKQQCYINGYTIPNKTIGIVNMWALGRDSEYWEEAEKFEPERFNESPLDVSGNHFQFIPFGAGRRICPGINFSMASMELCLAQLLCHFDWKLVNGASPQQLDMTVNFGNVASRKNSLYLLASPFLKQDAR